MSTRPQSKMVKHGMTTGKLPKGCAYLARTVQQFVRSVEAELEQRGVEITTTQYALIQTAARHERHALVCQRAMRLRWESLDDALRLAYSKEIPRASEARDRALAKLGVSVATSAAPASLYRPEVPPSRPIVVAESQEPSEPETQR